MVKKALSTFNPKKEYFKIGKFPCGHFKINEFPKSYIGIGKDLQIIFCPVCGLGYNSEKLVKYMKWKKR